MCCAAITTIAAGAPSGLVKAALFLLHSAVRCSAEVAQAAVERNALVALCERLEDADSAMKTGSVWCLSAVANHDTSLANAVVEAGAIPLLVLCTKEPSLPLRRLALSCIGSIAKHDHPLADLVQKEGGMSAAVGFLAHKDMLLRRQACRLLACALQHEGAPADWMPSAARAQVVETLGTADPETAAFAATLVQQLAKKSNSVASGLVDLGAVPLLVLHIARGGASPAPAAAALGHICDSNPSAAASALDQGVLSAIQPLLAKHAPVHLCAMLCLGLGAIANADEAAAAAVAKSGCLQLMAESTLLSKRKMGPAARAATRKGISKALSKCNEYSVMVYLLESLPLKGPDAEAPVLAALLKAIARLLSAKGSLRLDFMQRGALTLAQDAAKSSSSDLRDALKALNDTFPKQMVAATAPDYESRLLEQIK